MYKTVLPVLSVQTVLLVLVKLEPVWINWSISESTFWSEFPVVWSRFDYTFWSEFPDLPFTGGAFTLHSLSSKRSEFLELSFTGGALLDSLFTLFPARDLSFWNYHLQVVPFWFCWCSCPLLLFKQRIEFLEYTSLCIYLSSSFSI